MRRFLAAAGLAAAAPAWAQFATERPAAPVPVQAPGAPAAAPRVQPVPTTIDPTKDQPHPWAVKAEHGPWMICVRAYVGPNSRELAEKLVVEIRKNRGTAAYLFERNVVERKAEQAQIEAIRAKEREKVAPFLQTLEQERKKAELTGGTLLDDRKPTIKVPKPYRETPEQWAVMIGGFKTDVLARHGLNAVKTFPDPEDKNLMDRALVGAMDGPAPGKEQWKSEWNYANPYQGAMVVPNPAIAAGIREEKGKLDPDVVKMNEEGKYSLLKAKKPWTLIVRSYSAPMKFASRGDEQQPVSMMDRIRGLTSMDRNKQRVYEALFVEAEQLAAALGSKDMEHGPFKAFVLHHRTGSIVTVGEFDTIDDPELLKMQQLLSGLTFQMRDKDKKPVVGQDGRPEVQRLFDSVSPFPVPKY